MHTKQLDSFHLVGISIRTTNQHQKAAQDIPALWQRFMQENIAAKIPNKIEETIYCAYTEYEGDHNQPYTTLIGCQVSDLKEVPAGMKAVEVPAGQYQQYTSKGKLSDGIIINQWFKIWEADLERTYQTDFEVYGEKARDPNAVEVDIFVGVTAPVPHS